MKYREWLMADRKIHRYLDFYAHLRVAEEESLFR